LSTLNPDKPLKIVNASAGSGKTYTLVQEYLRIVLHDRNPFKFKSVLAMTFTNKAANEMKSRILDGLIQLSKNQHEKNESDFRFLNDTAKNLKIDPNLVEERAGAIVNQILHNYSAFSIMTIDKFTHRIIRTFAKDLNISVDFDVELDIKTLRKNVTDLLFDQIGRDQDLTNLMMRYARTNLNLDKSWDFSGQVFEFSDLLFKEDALKAIALLRKLSSDDFLKIQEDLQEENARISKSIQTAAVEALDLISSRGLDQDDFHSKSTGIVPFFLRVANGRMEAASKTLKKLVENNTWAQASSSNKHVVNEIAPLLEKYFYQIDNLIEGAVKKYKLNQEILANLNNLSLLNHLLLLVDGIKEEQNILLISDFYKKISEIIIHEKTPFIYERMGNRYEHFLLDEFQDTSHLQWINMIPLIHNSLASGYTNLIVGDGKQAIYRWRNGEVEQFTNLPERIL
jgi:ATP-dependent exoDNAse (exonuclease V) beta subunit